MANIQIEKSKDEAKPTLSEIEELLRQEGLEPDIWGNEPDYQYAVHSHNYTKIIYCVRGFIDFIFPAERKTIRLEPGDKMIVPKGMEHGAIVGDLGVTCVEGHKYG